MSRATTEEQHQSQAPLDDATLYRRVTLLAATSSMPPEEIARFVGVSVAEVETILEAHRWERETQRTPARQPARDELPRDDSGRAMIPSQGRGTRRTPRETEERVIALAATTSMTQQEIAEMVGIPRTTVATIIARESDEETFVRLRQQQKREWVAGAWDLATNAMLAANKGARDLIDSDKPLTARDVQSLAVATGIMIDKTAMVLGEHGPDASGGHTREVADAVLGAWQAGREEGRREAAPVNVTPGRVVESTAEVR